MAPDDKVIVCMDGNLSLKRMKRGKHTTIASNGVIKDRYFGTQEKAEMFADEIHSSREESSTENNHSEIVGLYAICIIMYAPQFLLISNKITIAN